MKSVEAVSESSVTVQSVSETSVKSVNSVSRHPVQSVFGGLRVHVVEHPRVWDGFADVAEAANPGNDPFDTHPESRMRNTSVLPEIQVPRELFLGKLVLLDPLQEEVVVVDSLAASDISP